MRVKCFILLGFITTVLCSSCQYSPLDETSLRLPKAEQQSSKNKLRATYLGNTTIHITDGKTNLLVDGFLSRPPAYRLLVGHYCSDITEIEKQLKAAKIGGIDAVLVAHTHGDHALDAPYYAKHKGSLVMGTKSYSHIHKAAGASRKFLHVVPSDGCVLKQGQFTITYVKSEHIQAKGYNRLLTGNIGSDFKLPAHFTKYKCGETYAIHIAHPKGSFAITTSAGSKPGQWKDLKADVLFLGIGLLSNFPPTTTQTYWKQAVEPLSPKKIVVTHWDNFSKKLPPHHQAGHKLTPPPLVLDRPKKAMAILKALDSRKNRLRVIDLGESIQPIETK